MTSQNGSKADVSIRSHLRLAKLAAGVLFLGFGGWAATTELSGAVLANGQVVVDTNVKKVQHPFGGVVGAIHVRNGQRVRRGDILLSLDPTVSRTNLAIVTKNLDALAIRQNRLEAERDGREAISLPGSLNGRLGEADVAGLLQRETSVFESRRSARLGTKAQLGERVAQLQEQILGQEEQVIAFTDSLALIRQELLGLENLYEKKLVALPRIMELKREDASIRGTLAQARAEIAQAKGRILEVKLQAIQVDEDLRSEVAGALSEVQEKAAELVERKVAALDQLQRIDLRAPADGVVHELSAHTVGGVIDASATLMLIVPESDDLSVEVRIEAQDRDQVHVGQAAMLRMSAFNQRTTPELKGEVRVIGADLVEDVRTGSRYYPARISLSAEEKNRLGSDRLAPGMPVESFVQTHDRTVLSYLVKPMADYLHRAFREE